MFGRLTRSISGNTCRVFTKKTPFLPFYLKLKMAISSTNLKSDDGSELECDTEQSFQDTKTVLESKRPKKSQPCHPQAIVSSRAWAGQGCLGWAGSGQLGAQVRGAWAMQRLQAAGCTGWVQAKLRHVAVMAGGRKNNVQRRSRHNGLKSCRMSFFHL